MGLQVCELECAHWKGDFMCSSCGSSNQAEFSSEMIIHLTGGKNLDNPGIWAFPTLLICLECGFSSFTAPLAELQQAGLCSVSASNWSQAVTPE
jgi:hypothetical protein